MTEILYGQEITNENFRLAYEQMNAFSDDFQHRNINGELIFDVVTLTNAILEPHWSEAGEEGEEAYKAELHQSVLRFIEEEDTQIAMQHAFDTTLEIAEKRGIEVSPDQSRSLAEAYHILTEALEKKAPEPSPKNENALELGVPITQPSLEKTFANADGESPKPYTPPRIKEKSYTQMFWEALGYKETPEEPKPEQEPISAPKTSIADIIKNAGNTNDALAQTSNIPMPKAKPEITTKLALKEDFKDTQEVTARSGYTAAHREELKKSVKILEGFSATAYPDGKDKHGKQLYSIGYGHQIIKGDGLTPNSKITEAQADNTLDKDLDKYLEVAFQHLEILGIKTPNAVNPFTEVPYQNGRHWPIVHTRTWNLLKEGDLKGAREEVKDSRWFEQTPNRVEKFREALLKLDAELNPPMPRANPLDENPRVSALETTPARPFG